MTTDNAFGRTAFGFPFGRPITDSIMNTHYCDRAFVYNTRTGEWTSFDIGSANFSSGTVNPPFMVPVFTQWTSGASGLEMLNTGHANTTLGDTVGVSATESAIESILEFNFWAPSPGARPEWKHVHVYWENSTNWDTLTSPAEITVSFKYDWGETEQQTIVVTPDAEAKFTRLLVPREARASSRLSLKIIHDTVNDPFGIEGVAIEFDDGGPEVRK